MLNKVQIIGNLGGDPEMRYTANGNAVTNFSVATSRVFTVDGDRREETEWFRVTAWGKLAETCAEYLSKGRLVYVEGRMQTRSWEDDSGNKRYATDLVANEVKFLGGKGDAVRPTEPDSADATDLDDLPF